MLALFSFSHKFSTLKLAMYLKNELVSGLECENNTELQPPIQSVTTQILINLPN